jgi:hypothetical protein
VYKILLESQVKENPIAYTKWEKCLKKDRMHTLTCINGNLFTGLLFSKYSVQISSFVCFLIIPPLPEGGGGYTVLPLSVLPSVQDIIRISSKRKTHSLYYMGKMFKEGQNAYFNMYKWKLIHFILPCKELLKQ